MPRMVPRFLFALAIAHLVAAGEPPVVRPSPRPDADVEAVLRSAEPVPSELRPLRVILVAGPKDHGPGQHDYPAWQEAWVPYLQRAPQVSVDRAFPWPTEAQFEHADVAVFYFRGTWDEAQVAALERFQRRGGGVVTLHWAIGVTGPPLPLAGRLGLAYPAAKYRHGAVDLRLAPGHPITRGFPRVLRFVDEPYWPFVGDPKRVQVLATSDEAAGDGGAVLPVPVFWTHEPADGGRAFVCVFGHYMWTFEDPLFRLLLLRGMAWAAREPVSRFDALARDRAAPTFR